MNWKQFFAETIKALTWPVTIAIIVLLLRGEIGRAISLADKVSFKDFEISFAKEVSKIRGVAEHSLPEVQQNSPKKQDMYSLASLSPSAGVMAAWSEVEAAAISLILSRNIELKLDEETPYKNIEKIITEYDLVKASHLKIFSDLRILRNKVAHAPQYEITIEQASEYVDLSLSLAEYFSSKQQHTA